MTVTLSYKNCGIFITKQFTLHLRQMIICATERKLTICYRRRNVAAAVDNNCHREPDTLHEYAIMMQNTTPQHERQPRTTIIIFPVITCAQAATIHSHCSNFRRRRLQGCSRNLVFTYCVLLQLSRMYKHYTCQIFTCTEGVK